MTLEAMRLSHADQEVFKTCTEYCAAQGPPSQRGKELPGGLTCTSAALGSISSCGVWGACEGVFFSPCDRKEAKTCDYAFQVYEHGICQCNVQQHYEDH